MRYTSNTRTLAFHFESLVALKNSWHLLVLAAAFIITSVTMSTAQTAADQSQGIDPHIFGGVSGNATATHAGSSTEMHSFDIETALEQLEEEFGSSPTDAISGYSKTLTDEVLSSNEYTIVFLRFQLNYQLRAEAATAALQAVMAEEQLRAEVQKLQLQNGTVIPMDEYNELQGAYFAMEEELTLLQGDYQVLHAALETACVVGAFRSDNSEACGIVLGTAEDGTN